MDNNGARNAEHNAHTTQKKRLGSGRGGGDSRLLPAAGIDERQRDSDEESEETPLLATENTSGQTTEDRPRRPSEYRPWDEFADLPWWKKPHVSA